MTDSVRPVDWESGELDLRDGIYLIKPNNFTTDTVYKVFQKGGDLYFCRVGGQFYEIREKESLNAQTPEDELLKPRRNFKIPKREITSAAVDAKSSFWTGRIHNSGTLRLVVAGKKQKYIIHGSESPKRVVDFFQAACSCRVQRLHMEKFEAFEREVKQEITLRNTSEEYKTVLKVFGFIDLAAVFAGLWMILFPRPYLAAVFVNLALVAASVCLGVKYREYMSFGTSGFFKKADFTFVLFFLPVLLSMRALLDYDVFYPTVFWIAVAALSVLCAVLLMLPTGLYRKPKAKATAIFLLIPFFALFYGSAVILNCQLDSSAPVKYETRVEQMETDDGKATTYHLTVAPWGNRTGPVDVQVGRSTYEKVHVGGSIAIAQKKGLFGMSWYEAFVG